MRVRIGNTIAKLIVGYRGHGKRWGVLPFANGKTYRAGHLALHVWRLDPHQEGFR